MILKGRRVGDVGFWSKYMTHEEEGHTAELKEIFGLSSTDAPSALREMQSVAAGNRRMGPDFMYHVILRARKHEHLTDEQWTESIDLLVKELGLEGHQRIVAEHQQEDGSTHRHILINLVNTDTLRVKDIGGNFYVHEAVAREIEKRFGLDPVANPDREHERNLAPELSEIRTGERTGIDPKQITAELTAMWQAADSGRAFVAALEDRGYLLVQGDKRGYCFLDHAGTVHSLPKRLDGFYTRHVRERLEPEFPLSSLPGVEEGKAFIKSRYPTPEAALAAWQGRDPAEGPVPRPEPQQDAQQRPEQPHGPHQERPAGSGKEPHPAVAAIREAWAARQGDGGLIAALEAKGMILARVTPEEAAKSERDHAFAAEVGNFAPKYRPDELVVVNERGRVYRLDGKTTGDGRAAVQEYAATIDRSTLLSVADARAAQQEAGQEQRTDERLRAKPETKIEARIAELRDSARSSGAFAAALYNEGITLARVDAPGKAKIEREYQDRYLAERLAAQEDGSTRKPEDVRLRKANFAVGELVAVTRYGDVHRLNPYRLDLNRIEEAATGGGDRTPSLSSAREFFAKDRADDKAQREASQHEFWQKYRDRMDGRAAASTARDEAKASIKTRDQAVHTAAGAPLRVVDGATGIASLLGNFVSAALTTKRTAPTDDLAQIAAQRRATAALNRIRESIERGEDLTASDVYALTPSHLENIKAKGDDGVREMIQRMERENEKYRGHGRERER